MRRWVMILGAVLFAAVAPAGRAQDAEASLQQIEARGLGKMTAERLRKLVKPRPKQKAREVQFTSEWIDSQPRAKGGGEWLCLTQALYFEARGESIKGVFAVAEVILNRVRSSRFPDTICDVVAQGSGRKHACQFSFYCDGKPETIHEPRAFRRMAKIARVVMDGFAPALVDGATHFHTTQVSPSWSRRYERTAAIGDHLFYRQTYGAAKN